MSVDYRCRKRPTIRISVSMAHMTKNGNGGNGQTVLRTVIVPAAGLGTRFLPVTKTVPKELLPVVDRPGIELIAEEAHEAGASRLAVVTSPRKSGLMKHFDTDEVLEESLKKPGKEERLKKVQRSSTLIDVVSVTQDKPLGLGHAVAQAEGILGPDEDVVAVMLPDDLVMPYGVMNKMLDVRAKHGGSVLCAVDVAQEETSAYGVFEVSDQPEDDVYTVTGMVEKPEPDDAPSTLVATGRYLLDREIFDALGKIEPGKGGELQLTDAIELLIRSDHPVHVVVHRGTRHDLGNPGGFIKACVDFGLKDPECGDSLRAYMTERLAQDS